MSLKAPVSTCTVSTVGLTWLVCKDQDKLEDVPKSIAKLTMNIMIYGNITNEAS